MHSMARDPNARQSAGTQENFRIFRTAAVIDDHNRREPFGGQILQQLD
jgi:hypothetical protein